MRRSKRVESDIDTKARSAEGEAVAIDAVIFDMDGVITDTAEAHAAVWKRLFDDFLRQRTQSTGEALEPFDEDADYRRYVDGKPRHDGVHSFLEARGIELPWGSTDDDPEQETICGLGNRKNGYFQAWLQQEGVRPFPDAVALIQALRQAGKGVGVFSSSRNAGAVLASAGVLELFDVKVDGVDLGDLNQPGKPDPWMLQEAARRLDVQPRATAVLEDAVSGVQAGRNGGFGLVVGVSRVRADTRQATALREAGADLVVSALSELRCTGSGLLLKRLEALPSVWDHMTELGDRLATRELVVLLDYDGTLTPIVEDPGAAVMADDMRDMVSRLADRHTVAIISGRDLDELRRLVGVESAYYAGSHGFDLAGPGDWRRRPGQGEAFLPDLDAAEEALRERLAGIAGHQVERKSFAIAVHHRNVADADLGPLERVVDQVIAAHDRLRKGRGKKVLQVQPDTPWDKGRAVQWLLRHLALDGPEVLPIYIGDDRTDEDAFRALAGRGLGIAVRDGERNTSADYSLSDPAQVRRFLDYLLDGRDRTP